MSRQVIKINDKKSREKFLYAPFLSVFIRIFRLFGAKFGFYLLGRLRSFKIWKGFLAERTKTKLSFTTHYIHRTLTNLGKFIDDIW